MSGMLACDDDPLSPWNLWFVRLKLVSLDYVDVFEGWNWA